MKAIIFGSNGQDGYYLSRLCEKKRIEVVGVSRSNGSELNGDVSSQEDVEKIIHHHHPEFIFHLAARSTTSHDALHENHETIGKGTINILESVRKYSPETKVFITGSGLQFINKGQPISEKDAFDHTSCYASVRNYSVYLARYFRQLGIKTYIGYLFHHESPLRTEQHVSQKIAKAAQRIADGLKETIELGDISVQKEWTYAQDIAEGILTLISQDQIFEAVIGSGKAYSIQDWIEECFKIINKDWHNFVTVNKSFKAEYPLLVSNPATINSLGWQPSTSLTELAEKMVLNTYDNFHHHRL